MSDNEDLLGDDLGDQSLADYNLGNEEEEQLLADDYESGPSQNVPASVGPSYGVGSDMVSSEFSGHGMEYSAQVLPYQPPVEPECVVPNITVEIPNRRPEHSTYAPYEPPVYEPEHAVVPPAIPAAPLESPQIVPSDVPSSIANGDMSLPRERFTSERAPGSQRLPQVRDIPDTLDKVVVARGGYSGGRGRTSWRNPQFHPRHNHPYRRNNMHRGNFNQRSSFPPQVRPTQLQIRTEVRPNIRPEPRPEVRPEPRPEVRPEIRPGPEIRPEIRPELQPERTELRPDGHPGIRPEIHPEMRMEIRPDIHPEMRPEIRPDTRSELGPDIRPEMHPEMRPDIRPDIRPGMRPDIHQDMHPEMRPDIRLDLRPDIRPDMRPDIRPDIRPEFAPDMRLDPHMPPQMGPEISPERPMIPDMGFRPDVRPFGPGPRFPQFRPGMEEPRPFRPNFEPRPMYQYRPSFGPRPFGPPMREIAPNNSHLPQVTIRQQIPGVSGPKLDKQHPREQEVIMVPVPLPLPPLLPPGGLAGKKVLINPHFKGSFQPPGEGPVKDIDDAAERFIAEQRNALARAANRKFVRRSPQRFIENTTIEIVNDMMGGPPRRNSDDELLRRQEQFINDNRAGLRRRMRSPSPPRRSPSPRRSPDRFDRPDRSDRLDRPDRPERPDRPDRSDRDRAERDRRYRSDGNGSTAPRTHDEESEYRRRVREQESLRERVLRAKEVRRRRNAVALHRQLQDRDRERLEKETQDKEQSRPEPAKEVTETPPKQTASADQPDTTRSSPDEAEVKPEEAKEVVRERSPVREEPAEVNSTCENLTPPRSKMPVPTSPARDLTPPLPDSGRRAALDSDDDLDLILGDIDGILSDDDDTGRFKEKPAKVEPEKPKQVDLRSKLPPKAAPAKRLPRQKIVFHDQQEAKKKDKSPPTKAVVTSSTKVEDSENIDKKANKAKPKAEVNTNKSRQRITFDNKEPEKEKEEEKKQQAFSNRRVILQRKITQSKDKSVFARVERPPPAQPPPALFSRAVRTALGSRPRDVTDVPADVSDVRVEYADESDDDAPPADVSVADVRHLPHGMTDTRLRTLAGPDVQSLSLDKDERTAKIVFKTTIAAEKFKRKFNNKMVAASRLTVVLR